MYMLLLAVPVIFVTLVLLRYLFRRHFPVSVSCWFCGGKTRVLYEFINCWDCPHCEQYNGFNKDGSYNKPIPAQYEERLNRPITCETDEFLGGNDLMCEKCSQNQLLKIKQLANFEPYNEANYDNEVEAYQRHLEKVYRLCSLCEVKVQQELQVQNEALSHRLGYLDLFRSFIDNSTQEEHILHSSYTDRHVNKCVLISVVLHSVSLMCSVLVCVREVELDGDSIWLSYIPVSYLHPVLLWTDRNVQTLSWLGLITIVLAKLCLGIYRCHIIDVISCPVWLLVLLFHTDYLPLSQTGTADYLPLSQTGSMYAMCCLVLNVLICLVCVTLNRRRWNKPDMRVTRKSLDASNVSDSMSSVSLFSSAGQTNCSSQVAVPSSHNEQPPVLSSSHVSSSNDVKIEHQDTVNNGVHAAVNNNDKATGNNVTQDPDMSEDKSDEELTQLHRVAKETAGCHSNIDEATTGLNAFTLGDVSTKRTHLNNGIFSTVCQSTSTSNLLNQSVSNNLRNRKYGERKPLITPATFNHTNSPGLSPLPQFGLFSTSSSPSPSPNFLNRPSPVNHRSAFVPTTQLLSSQRHSFTPERPASPVVTSFGERPFINLPLQSNHLSQSSLPFSDRHSQCSNMTYRTDKSTNSSRPMCTSCTGRQSAHVGKITELSDDEDNTSDITSVSRQYAVHSTSETSVDKKPNDKLPWWKQGEFRGFIMGASFVVNMVFISQIAFTYYYR